MTLKSVRRWNYRVVARTQGDWTSYGIHETHYEGDKVIGWTAESISPHGETLAELRADLNRMAVALELDVIDGGEL